MARDVATTKYVRWRLLQWRDRHGDLLTPLQIQKLTGAKASAISQIRSGKLGVGPAVLRPLAKEWGMTEGQLLDTARAWYEEQGAPADEVVDLAETDPGLAEAIEAIRKLNQVTDEQLRAIVAGYGTDYFRGRDPNWWMQTILAEAAHHRRSQSRQLAEERKEKRGQAKHRRARRELDSIRTTEQESHPEPHARVGRQAS